MLELVSCFRFQVMGAAEDVFLYGDRGETFYIIIKGMVGVRIPNPKIKDWKNSWNQYKELTKWVEELETRYTKLRVAKRQHMDEARTVAKE